jgi:hypothetical protein
MMRERRRLAGSLASLFVSAVAIVILPACASGNGASVAVLSTESESTTSRPTELALSSANVASLSPEAPQDSDDISGLSIHQQSSSEVPRSPAPPSPAPPLTCPGETMSFSLSMSYDMEGQPTPIEAAQLYVTQPWSSVQNVSTEALWTVGGRDPLGVTVTTDSLHLHAVRLPNQTWAIDGGEACSELSAPLPTG